MAHERLYRLFPPGTKRVDSSLTSPEVTFLEMYLFTDRLAQEIYRQLFNTKEMSDSSIKRAADNILNSSDAVVYLEDRTAQMQEFLMGLSKKKDEDDVPDEEILDVKGQFRPEVVRQVMIQAGKALKAGRNVDPKLFEKMFDHVLKKSDISAEAERPLRVLAESCNACGYRVFCEENCERVCDRCKLWIESEDKYQYKELFLTKKEERNEN
jgi:predicted Zn-ribbon and HTH transcriptional regulator